jgi:hypothetical protein
MEFKGTKGKWLISDCRRKIEVSNSKRKIYKSILYMTGRTKWQHDIKLISKAPEMLEMLKAILSAELFDLEKGEPTESYYQYFNQIEQLIKEATEL